MFSGDFTIKNHLLSPHILFSLFVIGILEFMIDIMGFVIGISGFVIGISGFMIAISTFMIGKRFLPPF